MSKTYAVGIIIAMLVVGLMFVGCTRGSDIGSASWPSIGSSGGSEKGGMRVRIFDLAGDPVEKATVEFKQDSATKYIGITDENGMYLFENIVVGTYDVSVTKGTFTSRPPSITVLPESIESREILFDTKMAVLEGQIFDEDKFPLSDVTILLTSKYNSTTSVTGTATTTTGIDGTFRIHLASDVYGLSASKAGYDTSSYSSLLISSGTYWLSDLTSTQTILLGGKGILKVSVVDKDNRPESGATVEVRSLSNPLLTIPPETSTSGGSIEYTRPIGTYTIQATKDQLKSTSEIRGITVGNITEVTLQLLPNQSITGVVRGYNGTTFTNLSDVTIEVKSSGSTTAMGKTDGVGSYSINVPAGTYDVVFSKPDYMTEVKAGVVVNQAGKYLGVMDLYPNPCVFG